MFKKNKIIDYIFVFLLLISGGTVLKVLGYTAYLNLFILFIFILLSNKKKTLSKTNFVRISIFLLVIFLINFTNYVQESNYNLFSNQFFNLITAILIGYFFTSRFRNRQFVFIHILNNVLFILLIHAILNAAILLLVPIKNEIFSSLGGNAYEGINFLFFQQGKYNYFGHPISKVNLFGLTFNRVHGIFWEPGVFAYYVNLFVFLNLFIFNRMKNVMFGILLVILTWSTTGVFVLVLQLFMYFFSAKKIKLKLYQILFLLSLGGAVVSITLINANEKFFDNQSKVASASQRVFDTYGGLNVISNNLMTGTGLDFGVFSKKMKEASVQLDGFNLFNVIQKDEIKFSNSLLKMLIIFGVPFGLFTLYLFHKQKLIPEFNNVFVLITFVSVCFAPILTLPFCFTFIISGIKK